MSISANDETLVAIAFIGNTLGPLFLYEPFTQKNTELYTALADSDVSDLAREWPFVNDAQAKLALTLMVDDLRADNTGEHDSNEDRILWEYRRLFVGPARKAAPPWGSVYTDREQVIFGESTLELRKWMRENGVAKLVPEGEPEDHIGLMLLMMSWLCENKPEALNSFLESHLLTWAPHFLGIVKDATAEPFFAGLAALTKASLEGISAKLELSVTEPRFYR